MTIKKRLFWSNILMIVVPVIVTAIVGLICIGFIWLSLIRGIGFGIHDQEEFDLACEIISEETEGRLGDYSEFDTIETLLANNDMLLLITEDGEDVYSSGKLSDTDIKMKASVDYMSGNVTMTQDNRAMYVKKVAKDGKEYSIYIVGNFVNVRTYANLKTGIIFSIIIIAFTIFISILFTDRFLIRFVFRRIEEPIDILVNGVHELSCGKLDYRIEYSADDEFTQVCNDFNEMADRLKSSIEKIKQQEQSRKELIAGISHDIRSPLTSIQAYVEGLMDGIANTPEKQQFYLQTIKNKAESMSHMVSQLFLFSKMELGEYIEHPIVMQLDEVIQRTVDGLKDEYERKGLRIYTDLKAVKVNADLVQVERIVTNIISNSLKYKDKEQGQINITMDEDGSRCRIVFADDGPGVQPEALSHLFEVFYRSDPSRTNTDKGSGLGLAIVANAVENMGGTVRAENGIDNGLVITITVPMVEV